MEELEELEEEGFMEELEVQVRFRVTSSMYQNSIG